MKNEHRNLRLTLCLAISVWLTGCGGGGSPDAPVATQAEKEAGFVQPDPLLPDTGSVGGSSSQVGGSDNAVVVPPPPPPPPTDEQRLQQLLASMPQVNRSTLKTNNRIGANVSAVSYFSRTHEYVDLMQHASGFGLPDGPWLDPATQNPPRGPIALDANGWPTEDFSVMVMGGQRATPGLSGRYTIVFRGTARLSTIASSGTLTQPVVDTATGLSVAYLDFPVGGDQIVLNFKNTNGGVKDLRVIRPGYQWNSASLPVFTAHYLQHLEPFSTLRFMDWMVSNSLYDGSWAARPTLINTRAGMRPKGQVPGRPWERVVELANASGSDIWINIPAKADPDYYTQLARLLKSTLDPRLKIYVEYSNEMWNFNFVQYHWLTTTAVDEELAAGNTNLKFDNATQPYVLGYRVYTERLFRISEAFRAVFGDGEMMTRVRPVLAWQAGGSYHMDNMLKYAQRVYPNRPINSYIYAISGAPYYGLLDKASDNTLTKADVLDKLSSSIDKAFTISRYEHNAFLAKKHNVKWIAYEGGPDTFGGASIEAKASASRDATMFDLCKRFLNDWSVAGGGLFMWFHAGAGSWTTQYGSWPLAEYLTDGSTSAKSACMTWAASNPAGVAQTRHVPNVAFDAVSMAGEYITPDMGRHTIEQRWYSVGQTREYVISSPVSACYKLSFTGVMSGNQAKFDVVVNNSPVITAAPVTTTTGTVPVRTNLGNICLDPGVNVMALKVSGPINGVMDKILYEPQ